jgi:hypothetical protein
MLTGIKPGALVLTEEEAFAILGLCLTSPQALDALSERAVKKLADYCSRQGRQEESYYSNPPQAIQAVS